MISDCLKFSYRNAACLKIVIQTELRKIIEYLTYMLLCFASQKIDRFIGKICNYLSYNPIL